ncbi:uncharacterized protein GGS25DRAFT_496785 [Hypoxylon fragiforme]|uniref:uncharacterized protein n=1 Tax=Hypoxylon fragiforme TaxID=63214 RepID=UPI0020C6A93F|nr:uncharacterized protein GGS25DRAFT_496785 [Hypoxylon fragiforme]KAI2607614.1 hypothetical protein GGS25DRAFT_496785 [Hypoxylon fragiforme]
MRHLTLILTTVLLFLITTTPAAPLSPNDICNPLRNALLTFQGAITTGTYSICVPVDAQVYALGGSASIAQIVSYAADGVYCAAAGVDRSFTVVNSREKTAVVRPPQPQVRVACVADNSTLPLSMQDRYRMRQFVLS